MAESEQAAATPPPDEARVRPEDITAVPVRHPFRWLGAAFLIYVVVAIVNSMVTNPKYEWDVVGEFLFSETIIRGLGNTLALTVVAMVIGVVLGILIAVARQSENPVLSRVAWVWVWFFRGTPVVVQLLAFAYIGALYPEITLGVPFGGPDLMNADAKTLIAPWTAAILGLALNESAYMAEIVRGGLLSVDEGQEEAASALGMSRAQTLRRIVLPQAMRVIIPPTGNETISMLKLTSLVFVIPLGDLLYNSQLIYAANYKIPQLLIVASIWYLVITSILQVGQYYIERHYGRGTRRDDDADGLGSSVFKGVFGWKRGEVPTPPTNVRGV